MPESKDDLFPDFPGTRRTVAVRGLSKMALLAELRSCAIRMNESAEQLIRSESFVPSESPHTVTTIELSVQSLGFPQGATEKAFHDRAAELGLVPCPLEVGPHLRLQYLDQPEGSRGKSERKHRAPYGSLTVVSKLPNADDSVPRGFYLRCIEGELWLRAYRSFSGHVWDAEDRLVFAGQ